MNVLHITNEISKKNFSISSLIFFFIHTLDKHYPNINSQILISKVEKDFIEMNNFNKLKKNKIIKLNFFFFILPKILKKFDFIHIHGVWAPIQLVSIICCCIMRIRFVVHPHGMLLDEAINSGSFLKKKLKRISLILINIFQVNKIKFISITDQETREISNYFKKNDIKLAPNPFPFELYNNSDHILEKKFVYFGRIHPIKNINLIVKSFIKSKLYSDGWKLDIFGIKDDNKYLLEIQKLVKTHNQISIKNPVFGKEKQEIMQKSWCNVLLSKSEVLSLSLIESSALGLPTIYPSALDSGDYKSSTLPVDLDKDFISQKFKEVSKISLNKRIYLKNKIIENFSNIQKKNIRVFIDVFIHLYSKNQLNVKNRSIFEYLIISSGYIFNFFITSFLVVLLAFNKNYSLAADIGLIGSFWISLTQIFSGNKRILILSEIFNLKEIFLKSIFFRILASSIFLFLIFNVFIDIFKNYFEINIFFIISISLLILVQWINEIVLSKKELENNLSYFYKIFFVYTFYLVLVSSLIFINKNDFIVYLNYILILFIISNLIEEIIFINFQNFSIWKLSNVFKFDLSYFSSFFLNISSFIWRFFVFSTFEKSLAAILYACFSLGSFPGTVFNNIIGPTYVKNKIKINAILNQFLKILIIITIIFSLYYLYRINSYDLFREDEYLRLTISLSLIGSFIMVKSLYMRQKMIFEKKIKLNTIFYSDIITGVSIVFILPILNILGGDIFVSFSYLTASLISFIFYSILNQVK